jgi:hypothetical protein
MRAIWRTAVRSFGGEVQRAILARGQLVLLAIVFLAGLLLTWALTVPLRINVVSDGARLVASPAAVAASFVLGLGLLCICFSLLPSMTSGRPEGHWGHLCAWLQMVDLAMAGYLGVWLAPGSGLRFGALLALVTLTCAYAAALCGTHAVLCAIRGRPSPTLRAALVVVLALAIAALLWTKAPLQALQHHGERGVAAYDTGTQVVASLSPVMGWAAFWSADETGFNLTKTTHTYQLWLGPSFISFPGLWPGRSGLSDQDWGPWGLGLVIGLLTWGLVLCIAGDTARASMRSTDGFGGVTANPELTST